MMHSHLFVIYRGGGGPVKHEMVIWRTYHSLVNTSIAQSSILLNKIIQVRKISPFLSYNFFSFIYVGEVVGTSEAGKMVLGGTQDYPPPGDGHQRLRNLWG